METPPQARGSGRSGPRRRTGCLTCRARKVRCDEAKPKCANCTRLRLQCIYKSVIIPSIGGRSSRARSSSSSVTLEVEEASFLRTVLQPNNNNNQDGHEHQHEPQTPPAQPQARSHTVTSPSMPDSASDFQIPFDMLGCIGEINSVFQQKHDDLTNSGTATTSSIPEVDGVLFNDEREMSWGPRELGDTTNIPESNTPRSTEGLLWEEQLLEHFRESNPPPTIFGPIDLEWRYVRDVMLTQSGSCRMLLTAIYCYSDMHKAWVGEKHWRLVPTYYQQASSEIELCLRGEVSELMLQRVFTSVFLLMLAELLSTSNAWRPAAPFLHSAYLLLQRYHSRTRLWTGFAHLVVSWVSLLDVKALVAGRDGDPLTELGILNESNKHVNVASVAAPAPPPIATTTNGRVDDDHDGKDSLLSQPGYLIQDAIVGPAFQFFLQTQQVVRRIVCIDLHHRSRGTVSDEFEVLQIAHQIGTDLETLWNRRPRVLDVYNQPESLQDILSPSLAMQICRTFRQYVANFLSLFIYLHRVAFAIYPRTDRVYRAVDQIIQLATVESRHYPSLPTSFIWPLFVAGLEGSRDQQTWIVQEMHRMASLSDSSSNSSTSPSNTPMMTEAATARHPNAAKALVLLEEMTRRQDASRTWADSRCVRRELFTDFFIMI